MLTNDDKQLIEEVLQGADWIDQEEEKIVKGDHMNDGREYRYQADWSIGTRMFHVRCDDWTVFQESVKNMETVLPSVKSFPDDEGRIAHTATEQDAGNCPKCGAPLVIAKKKDGTPYKKCSTNKWDRVRKIATGCDYVDWN